MFLMTVKADEKKDMENLVGSDKTKFFVQTTNKVLFSNLSNQENTVMYYGEHISFPNKSFGFGYISNLYLGKLNILSKVSLLLTKGLILEGSTPYQFGNLITAIQEISRSNEGADKIRELNKKMKEKWKEKRNLVREENKDLKAFNKKILDDEKERVKALNKEIKKTNKEKKEAWQKAVDSATEEMREFMPEPEYLPKEEERDLSSQLKELKPLPEEPNYREVPYSKSYSIERLDKMHPFAWRLLSKFEFCRLDGIINNKQYYVMLRREQELKYREEDLLSISLDKSMSLDEFREFFKKNEINDRKYLENYRQDVSINPEQLDIYSKEISFENAIFEEDEVLAMEKTYPPLAPLKPQQKASMISGLKISKVINTEQGKLIIKSAPVEVTYNRTVIVGNKEVAETLIKKEDLMAIYNMNYREAEEL